MKHNKPEGIQRLISNLKEINSFKEVNKREPEEDALGPLEFSLYCALVEICKDAQKFKRLLVS